MAKASFSCEVFICISPAKEDYTGSVKVSHTAQQFPSEGLVSLDLTWVGSKRRRTGTIRLLKSQAVRLATMILEEIAMHDREQVKDYLHKRELVRGN